MVELHPHAIAHGGEAVARRDGKAHFVAGVIPGEVVEAVVTEDKGSWARAELVRVIEPSEARREPPCPHATDCGGCQWQFAGEEQQREWKRETVRSQLAHLGKIEDPLVNPTATPGEPFGYRGRMDFHVVDGRPALMRPKSNDPVPLTKCLLLDPLLQSVFERFNDLTGADRVTLRCGSRTNDVIAIVEGALPAEAETWGVPVLLRRGNSLEAVIGDPHLEEIIDETRFSIPFGGFFQNNTAGADALVALAREAADIQPDETLLDGYCGVGLFGATIGQDADYVVGIDSVDEATDYARRNLQRAGVDGRIVTGSFTRDIEKLDAYWDVAIVDPPRKGLGHRGVDAVTSSMPRRIVYVSCDPASLARDARVLADFGYEFIEATPVDMFPQTYHVEIVATFDRAPFEDGDE